MALAASDSSVPREPDYTPGDWELGPIHLYNKQWAVTDYGIENVAGPYHCTLPKEMLHTNAVALLEKPDDLSRDREPQGSP